MYDTSQIIIEDDKIPVDDEIKNIDGVIGVNRTETQFQIIIGPSVAKVYEAVCKQGELNSISETSEAGKEEKDEITRIPDFLYLILSLEEYIPVRMLKHPTGQTAIPSLHSHPFLLMVLNPAEMHSRMF